jgi:hypothetical protein
MGFSSPRPTAFRRERRRARLTAFPPRFERPEGLARDPLADAVLIPRGGRQVATTNERIMMRLPAVTPTPVALDGNWLHNRSADGCSSIIAVARSS